MRELPLQIGFSEFSWECPKCGKEAPLELFVNKDEEESWEFWEAYCDNCGLGFGDIDIV